MAFLPEQPEQQQPQQPPGLLDSIASGIQSRNLLPALALGGIIGLLPPLLYGKRSRRGASRAWGNIGTQLAFNELARPEREQRAKRDTLGRLVSAGLASTTGAPGAKPLGEYGGIDLYRTPTIAEAFPHIFSPPPSSGLTETDLGDGKTPVPPAPRQNPAIALFGAMPSTPENMAAVAKFYQSQQDADLAEQRRKETAALIMGQAGQNDYEVYPGMGSKGEMTFRTGPKQQGPKPSQIEVEIELENQRRRDEGLPPMNARDNLEFRKSRKGSLGTDIAYGIDLRAVSRALSENQETLDGELMTRVPDKWRGYARNLQMWRSLKESPEAMKELDEDTHGQIAFLLEKNERLVREKEALAPSSGQSHRVTMPSGYGGGKPTLAPRGDVRANIRSDLREWGFKK